MVKRLLKSLREYKKPAILTMIVMMCEVIMEVFIPYIMSDLIDTGFNQGNMSYILKTGLLLVGCSVLSLCFGSMGSYYGAKAGTGFAKNLRSDVFKNVQTFSFANIDKFSSSSIITRLTTDIANVQNTFTMCIRLAVRQPMTMLFSIIMMSLISWKMALVTLAAVPILLLIFLWIGMKAFPIMARVFKIYDRLNRTVQENLHGIRVVKSFVREKFESKKFSDTSNDLYIDYSKAEKLMATIMPGMMGIMYVVSLFLSYLGAKFIVGSEQVTVSFMGEVFTTGLLNSVFSYSMQILFGCIGFSAVFVMLMISRESMHRIDEVLCEEASIKNPENPIMEVPDGSIEFRNVNFSYKPEGGIYCLSDIDLKISSGETVGIIGGTGSSKSTLVQLIPRLYDVTSGEVLVGGNDIRNYDIKVLRDSVSMVLQKNLLFSGTIKDNLRWGNPDATDEEMIHACELSAADGFVKEFPDQYDTEIDQGGKNVSGGQKQRLTIARALLKKPRILILDDSTSAVDTATDALIQKSFAEEIPNVTKLIIAQRISSVEHADKIIVMDGGKVNDVGTHAELLERNEIYREVYESQKKGGDEDGR